MQTDDRFAQVLKVTLVVAANTMLNVRFYATNIRYIFETSLST